MGIALRRSAVDHRHLCPRQVLGVRMGKLAGELLRMAVPQSSKSLIVIVETDGCFADGVRAATGCSVGHRTMRVMDFGKVAACFVDTTSEAALRIAPHAHVRQKAFQIVPQAKSRWHAQLEAYQVMDDEALLTVEWVSLNQSLSAILSRPGVRVNCQICGEEIINERELVHEGSVLCRACAGHAYYGTSVRSLERVQ
jgi:formylmethanofuran dehydrogenase subunit E